MKCDLWFISRFHVLRPGSPTWCMENMLPLTGKVIQNTLFTRMSPFWPRMRVMTFQAFSCSRLLQVSTLTLSWIGRIKQARGRDDFSRYAVQRGPSDTRPVPMGYEGLAREFYHKVQIQRQVQCGHEFLTLGRAMCRCLSFMPNLSDRPCSARTAERSKMCPYRLGATLRHDTGDAAPLPSRAWCHYLERLGDLYTQTLCRPAERTHGC